MPITNGNYIAPNWANGQAPAINDSELTAMSQTLQSSQILHGSGAPTQYTSGAVGQFYVDISTSPNTIYQLKVSQESANVWEMQGDPNVNIALQYSSSSTYTTGDYRIYEGLLYRAKQNISPAEEWTAGHWERVYLAEELADHVADKTNPHEVTKAQAGLGNVENVLQYSASNPPIVLGSITLYSTWSGSGPYMQTVTVSGATVTSHSMISLLPTAAQVAALVTDGITALMVENTSGTLTAYAVGGTTTAAMTIQCAVEETA